MNNVLKSFTFEISLVKPYMKSIFFSLLVPIGFAIINRSLTSSVSFAMCFIAMTSSYTFSISEKNGMERLYGVLPVTHSQFVVGKYLYMILLGVFGLSFSILTHSFALSLLSVAVTKQDIFMAILVGWFMFTLYIVFQIPGYYKLGAIRGRVFMYIPVLGFLITLFTLQQVDGSVFNSMGRVSQNEILLSAVLIVFSIICFAGSASISIKIVENKEI